MRAISSEPAIHLMKSAKAYVGPFWFEKNYTMVKMEDAALEEFDNNDLRNLDFKLGDGKFHANFKAGSDNMDRGRVMVYAGTVYISVGYNCPNEAIELVKREFKLNYINPPKIEVERTVEYDRVHPVDENSEDIYEPFEESDIGEYD